MSLLESSRWPDKKNPIVPMNRTMSANRMDIADDT